MPKVKAEESDSRPKNIKNIYVQKINSLMKISRDNLGDEELEIPAVKIQKEASSLTFEKKIKKNLSEMDKTNIKKQKNRESARKARQRKNLYIKMLEKHVNDLTQESLKGSQIESQSYRFYTQMSKLQVNSCKQFIKQDEEEFEKYISSDDLGSKKESQIKKELRKCVLSQVANEIRQLYEPEFLQNFNSLTKQNQVAISKKILSTSPSYNQTEDDPKNPKALFKKLFKQQESLKKSITVLNEINQQASNLIQFGHMDETLAELSIPQLLRERIRGILSQLGICDISCPLEFLTKRIEKFSVQKYENCEQFPMDIQEIMDKIVIFDAYTQNLTPGIQQQDIGQP